MLDIDGTLCDIAERPGDAEVPEEVRNSLRTLIAHPGSVLRVAFVTGRSVADAQRMLGLDGVTIYGNHGMERLFPPGMTAESTTPEQAAPELRDFVRDLAVVVADFPGAAIEDKRFSLSLHFRGIDMTRLPELTARVAGLAGNYGVGLSMGKCVIDVLPAGSRTKGDAVLEIVGDAVGDSDAASILFVGDDTTDEDAFRELRALPNAVTVRVGEASDTSAAKLSVANPRAVYELLSLLAESRS